jgi:MoxR-like ATPase/soluble cytochrome b562
MASIKDSSRLLKRVFAANLLTKKGLALTMLLSGPHGIGKTQIVHAAAKSIGGKALVVEGGSLKEGEITGLPFASPTLDGGSEVRFVPYFIISNIQKVEKEYHRIAREEGFLGGAIKLEGDAIIVKEDGKIKKFSVPTKIERLINGELNDWKFGEELEPETKLKLIESGEIKPIFLFIDELNRTETQTMKELMNIVLNRNINGYDLPWWVTVVGAVNPSSQNSTYATNEMDDAQKDRFLKIVVNAKIDEWVDYALNAKLNNDIVAAVATADDIFMRNEKGYQDTDEMSPSPRSWEMVSYIYESIEKFNNSKLFTSEEKKKDEEDLRALINGKVGATAGRTLLAAIANKENNIKPSEIINGKSDKIEESIVAKFNRQKPLRRKITADNVVRHIANTIVDFEEKRKSTKIEEKKQYVNYKEQVKEFVNMLDDSTKVAFAKKLSQVDQVVATDGKNVFSKISDCFVDEVLDQLVEFEGTMRQIDKEK